MADYEKLRRHIGHRIECVDSPKGISIMCLHCDEELVHCTQPKPDFLDKLLKENLKRKLKPGTQIVYIPPHAGGDPTHPDTDRGFVTSVIKQGAFCRYWSKFNPFFLRTTSCSELTPFDSLVIRDTHPQVEVNQMLESIKIGEEE